MGTPALLKVKDEDGRTIVCVYAQCDGYPEDFGKDIVDWLRDRRVVNGHGLDTDLLSNGMGELAAHLVTFLKNSSPHGHYYLAPEKGCGAEFIYELFPDESENFYVGACDLLNMKVSGCSVVSGRNRRLYLGKVCDYYKFLQFQKEV